MFKKYAFILACLLLSSSEHIYASVESHKSLQTTALNFLLKETKDVQDSEITLRPLDKRLRLHKCSSPLEAFWPLENKKFGSTTVGIRCRGDKPWKIYLGVYIHIYKYVWVASSALSRGQIIATSNVRKEKRDVTKLSRGYLPASTPILGQQLKQNIHIYQVLTDTMLQSKKLINRGDRVIIISKQANIVVQANGVALANGAKGDRIRVRNMSSKREIEAYVSDKHRVLLNL